jgi:hypothetical protein
MGIMSRVVDKYTDKKQVKLIFPFFISAIAECVCLVVYLPIDTLRTRVQVHIIIKQMNTSYYEYDSMWQGLKQIK